MGTLFCISLRHCLFLYALCCEYKWDQVHLDLVQKICWMVSLRCAPLENWIKIFTLLNTLLLSVNWQQIIGVIGLFFGTISAEIVRSILLYDHTRVFRVYPSSSYDYFGYCCFMYPVFGLTTTALVVCVFHSVAYFLNHVQKRLKKWMMGHWRHAQIKLVADVPCCLLQGLLSWIAMRAKWTRLQLSSVTWCAGTIGFINQ